MSKHRHNAITAMQEAKYKLETVVLYEMQQFIRQPTNDRLLDIWDQVALVQIRLKNAQDQIRKEGTE